MAGVVLADVDERVLFGELGEGGAEAAGLVGTAGEDDRLEGRQGEVVFGRVRGEVADRVADADRAEAPDPGHLAGRHERPARRAGRREDADGSGLRLVSATDADASARPERAGEESSEGHALPGGSPLDLEDAARYLGLRIAVGGGQQVRDAFRERVEPGSAGRRTEEDRVDLHGASLRGEQRPEPADGERPFVRDVVPEHGVVPLGKHLGQPRAQGGVAVQPGAEAGGAGTGVVDGAHGDHARREPARHRLEHALAVRAGPVDLVDEDQRRDGYPPERPHEQRRLGLDALDRGDDEDRPVQDAKDALDLGDEVRVAGRIDDVDREVAEGERRDGRLDRDAALALELEGVGLGRAGVDAADVVDRAGVVEKSLGEGGLTGVDVGEDSEIERTHGASCLPRRSGSPSGWT